MEKVTAYKAFNGRLFDSEEKCLAYEKKYSQYPKIKEKVVQAKPYITDKCVFIESPITKHITETWETPSAQKKVDYYYIVCNKYKFMSNSPFMEQNLMSGCLFSNPKHSNYWGNMGRHFAEIIIRGEELTDEVVNREVELVNNAQHISTFGKNAAGIYVTDFVVEVIEKDKSWRFENIRWREGAIAPYIFTIEKL